MSVDLRIRSEPDAVPVDPERFFGTDLPAIFARERELLRASDDLRLGPLTIACDGDAWTLRRRDARLVVERATPDDETAALVRLSRALLADLVNDQITPVGLLAAGTLDMPRGTMGRFLNWWLVLRSALDGLPVYRAGSVPVDLDLGRSFRLGADVAEMRSFLENAGYLHLRGVFDQGEMDRISADMDRAAPGYRRDDGKSWWAKLADGSERVVRMQAFDERSEHAAALLADPRFSELGSILDCGHAHTGNVGNAIEALFKPLGVVEGISDVPWHKDCSLGRHSYECCSLTVGVSITGAGPDSGQLHVVAGSHRARIWPAMIDPATLDLPDVALPTETGDVTLHLSCVLHRAEPPTRTERRVLYTRFALPARDPGATRAAHQRMVQAVRERAPFTLSQPASRLPG
jgi:ectoine hydroxylase-related dioxygenase (phytanoyl-CoA dioxygenase family)